MATGQRALELCYGYLNIVLFQEHPLLPTDHASIDVVSFKGTFCWFVKTYKLNWPYTSVFSAL